jgi:hypothetical protein
MITTVTGCGLQVAGYRLRVAGCGLRVAGCGLQVGVRREGEEKLTQRRKDAKGNEAESRSPLLLTPEFQILFCIFVSLRLCVFA